jgi:23S rRNA (cytidine1920-2'-O)/16S rRNA (cytidine1409-2'-O)-methyltransferase
VYAVDVGYGQLLGSLRQDVRVVALERTNLADLDHELVPERIGVVSIDVSYVALARAVPQLGCVELEPAAELVAVVKPMFELGLDTPPASDGLLELAVAHAAKGIENAGWRVTGHIRSPVAGARGAVELFLHARRRDVTGQRGDVGGSGL